MINLFKLYFLFYNFFSFSVRKVDLPDIVPLQSNYRSSSYPYLSGDSFRFMANHIYDETDISFSALRVKRGDIIFVNIGLIGEFFEIEHPKINNPYILVTHNLNLSAPGKYEYMLNDPKIIKWFGSNPSISKSKKFQGIPLGLPNPHWPRGNIEIFNKINKKNVTKKYLLSLNFDVKTCPERRQFIYDIFKVKKFCTNHMINGRKPIEDFLLDVIQSKFVLSPFGSGYDCHRTWEILYMGSYPIVISSPLNHLYQDLPVLIVDKWEDVNETLLNRKYTEFISKNYKMKKLYCNYWINKISKYKSN